MLTLPMLLLAGCAAAAAPAPTAVPVTAPATAQPVTAEAVDEQVAADQYWSRQRLAALDKAKRKYKAPAKVDDAPAAVAVAMPLDSGMAQADPAPDPAPSLAPAPAAVPVADVAPAPDPAPIPVPTTPPSERQLSGTVSDEEFFGALQGMVLATELDFVTVEGLQLALGELSRLELTPRQRRVLDDLIAEVGDVIGSGPARGRDTRWDLDEISLPPVLRKGLSEAEALAETILTKTQ